MSTFFSSYSICYGKDKVQVADGSYSSIAGKGMVHNVCVGGNVG